MNEENKHNDINENNEENMTMEELLNLENDTSDNFLSQDDTKLVDARIVKISTDTITVDVGLKSEAFIPIEEFLQFSEGDLNFKIKDTIKVLLIQREDQNGIPIVSYSQAKKVEILENLKNIFNNQETIEATIKERVKGGYRVLLHGIIGFLPLSHAPFFKKEENVTKKKFNVLIIEFKEFGKNLVVSYKNLINIEKQKQKEKLLEKIKPGLIIKGKVKNISNFGAFIDIGGIDGLLHKNDIDWGRVVNIEDYIKVGQVVEVKVLNFDINTLRTSLGIKQLSPDPWDNIETKFKVGNMIKGEVIKILKKGVIVSVLPGIDGFINIEDLSWTKRIKSAKDIVRIGNTVEVKIFSIDKEKHNLNLSLKHVIENPWKKFQTDYKKGDSIKGIVTGITTFGAFVKVNDYIDGLIHIDDMSWDKSVKNPNNILKPKDTIEAIILDINPESKKLSLGLKQKNIDPFLSFNVNQNYNCTIKHISSKYLILSTELGFEGLIPFNHTNESKEANLKKVFSVNQSISCKLIEIDNKKRQLLFSIKKFNEDLENNKIRESLGADDFKPTFGDVLGKLMDKKNKKED